MTDLNEILNTVAPADVDEIVSSVLLSGDFSPTKEIGSALPYTKRASVNDIVPEEYQQKLMAIDFTMSQCYWLIGDITTDLVNNINRQRSKEMGKIISKTDIFEAVGFFCHRTSRSVRYYYECAHYFPQEVRSKYDVPFNVYADARWVKDWELLLQIAAENPIWSAEHIRAEYYKQAGEEVPVRQAKDVQDSGAEVERDDLPLPSEGEQWEGQAPSRFKAVLLSELEHTVDKLRAVLDKIRLPTDIRARIGDVLIEIQDIELAIRREA